MVTTTQQIIIAVFAIAIIFVLSRFFGKQNDDYERAYTEILTSDKYKVKGRFEE